MAARPVELAEVKNRGAIQTLSLHTGWFVAVSRAPVYDATKKPTSEPTTCKQRPRMLNRSK
jgi:hypothetical protein